MTFPKTGGTEWAGSQAAPWTPHNEALRRVDALASRAIVVDRDLTAPPGICADGANYLIAAAATGAWAGQDGKLATAVGANAANGWLFQTVAVEGYRMFVQDEDVEIRHTGAAWIDTAQQAASASDIWAGSSGTKFIAPAAALAAGVATVLASAASITADGANGLNFQLTLAHDATLEDPSNFGVGRSGVIAITQDGAGSRTLAYGGRWKFPGGAPVLSTAPGSVDLIAYWVLDAGNILATLTKGYST